MRPRRNALAIAALAALAAAGGAGCGSEGDEVVATDEEPIRPEEPADEDGTAPGELPVGGSIDVEISVGEQCWEIWFRHGDAEFRSRDFPDEWAPGEARTGTMHFPSPTEAVFESDDGEGTATFHGGEEAVFTMDCPVYPGAGGPATEGLVPEGPPPGTPGDPTP